MYYDGKKIFEVPPTSGSGRQQVTLPSTGRQVGIRLVGNKDPQTRWEYVVSCTPERRTPERRTCPQEYAEYEKKAWARFPIGDPLVVNQSITTAYKELYLEHEDWAKWAGLAAIASDQVGSGMRSTMLGQVLSTPNGLLGLFEIRNQMALGNQKLFLHIYPQHLIYACEGIEGIERFASEGKIPRELLQAWQSIADGDIWGGNTRIAEYEQKMFLQKLVFEPYASNWKSTTKMWSFLDSLSRGRLRIIIDPFYNPMPQGISFIDMPFAPGERIHDFSNATQRFRWIKNYIIPKFQALSPDEARQLVSERPKRTTLDIIIDNTIKQIPPQDAY